MQFLCRPLFFDLNDLVRNKIACTQNFFSETYTGTKRKAT